HKDSNPDFRGGALQCSRGVLLFVAGIVFIQIEEEEKEAILSTPPAPTMPLKLEKPTRLVKIQVPVDFEFDPYYYSWKEVNGADWYEYAYEGFSGDLVVKRTLKTRHDDTYDEVIKVRACNENVCSDWAYFK
ncbi:MAG: hypothetical protein OXI02_07970, partial [Candidatus Dadabacteria bacterium]|nr:hypothetical protein [Candidatus Dadabacteria bacterium]MDE0477975.1 hypothetical protein [Candidatus Dadabacteria bacterium]